MTLGEEPIMTLTVTLNWKNKSVNITKQAIYFGDENAQTLLNGNIVASDTTYTHTLPSNIVGGKVYYRISSIVTTVDGDVEETSTTLMVDLDVNKGFTFTTTDAVVQVMTLTPFKLYSEDGNVYPSVAQEVMPGFFASMLNTVVTPGKLRIVPDVGNTFELFYIDSRIDTVESWGDYTFTGTSFPGLEETIPMLIKTTFLTSVPNIAPITTDLRNFFQDATLFNDPNVLTWDMSNVHRTSGMFRSATSFNQPIGIWNTSGITDLQYMFNNALAFNQDLSQWCLPTLTETDISGVFDGCPILPEFKPVAGTCPRGEVALLNIVDNNRYKGFVGLEDVTPYTLDFNTNLVGDPIWTSSNPATLTVDNGVVTPIAIGTATVSLQIGVTTATVSLEVKHVGLPMTITKLAGVSAVQIELTHASDKPTGHYLITDDFGNQQDVTVNPGQGINVTFYSNGINATNIQIHSPFVSLPFVVLGQVSDVVQWPTNGWDSLKLGSAVMSVPTTLPITVKNLEGLFAYATSFNQDISGWDVSRVTNLDQMFLGCALFNQPIGTWNVGNVESMRMMFTSAVAFNQDIGGWNVSKCTNMQEMIRDTTVFDQDLSLWCVPGSVANYNFSLNSAIQTIHLPVWGTCPRGEQPL
jgi:surface protein